LRQVIVALSKVDLVMGQKDAEARVQVMLDRIVNLLTSMRFKRYERQVRVCVLTALSVSAHRTAPTATTSSWW
jgi:hypothetical protein